MTSTSRAVRSRPITALSRREFDRYGGPRVEYAFRFAVLALFEANVAICAEDPRGGRGAEHTILDAASRSERGSYAHRHGASDTLELLLSDVHN